MIIAIIINAFCFSNTLPCSAKGKQEAGTAENIDRLFLVFAGPYTSNPSSSFGHIFLLVKSDSDGQNINTWSVYNFGGSIEGMSDFEQIRRGLIGDMRGEFSSIDFYKKLREYKYVESRDIWLFELNFDNSEKQKLINSLNELLHKDKLYRFHDYNCASYVEDLLLQTQGKPATSRISTTPLDVLQNENIRSRISNSYIIPSFKSQYGKYFNKIDSQKDNVSQLSNTEVSRLLLSMEWLSEQRQLDYNETVIRQIKELRLRAIKHPDSSRSQIMVKQNFDMHPYSRFGAGIRTNNAELMTSTGLNIKWRLGIHDFRDPASVFSGFDGLNLLQTDADLNTKSLTLNQFWLFNQYSRTPTTNYLPYNSWDLSLGFKRRFSTRNDWFMGLIYGYGKTISATKSNHFSLLLQAGSGYRSRNELGEFEIFVSPVFEYRYMVADNFQLTATADLPVYLIEKVIGKPLLTINSGYHLNTTSTINVGWQSFENHFVTSVSWFYRY